MTETDPPNNEYDRQYPALLGRLIANLSTLEFSLRVALYLMDTPRENRRSGGWRIAHVAVGEQIEDCWLTSWCYLTDLIHAFNERQLDRNLTVIDAGIADLRNAMAHGVITAADGIQPASCIKFSRPRSGIVQVDAKYELSLEWIGEQTDRVFHAGKFVVDRIQELR